MRPCECQSFFPATFEINLYLLKKLLQSKNVMRYTFLFLLLSLGSLADGYSQESVHSKVIDVDGVGIPFASIGIIERNFGAVTFEDGSFSLTVDHAYIGDTLVVSAVGYKSKKIAYELFISEQPLSLMLSEEVTVLSEIIVSPEKLSFREKGMKKNSSPNHLGISSPLDGATVAFLVEDVAEPVLIDEIAVTIRQLNMDSIRVRCRVFEQDPDTRLPGEDLLMENMVNVSTEKQQRLVFSPSGDLWIDRPFFVGFEWVMTRQQFAQLEQAKAAFSLDFVDEIVAQNPGYNYNINENKRIQFRDSTGNLIKKVKLTKEQSAILDAKDAASPKLQFKINIKGTRTFTGSPITGKWSKSPHEALVSVKVGEQKGEQEVVEVADFGSFIAFGNKKIPETEWDLFLEGEMKKRSIPGISFAVFSGQEILHDGVKGYADIENNILVSEQTIFEGASLSKPLFAYFVMKYVDAGLVDLDRPLYEYLPYPDIAYDERYKKITARMVLSHTTGFPNWRADYDTQKLFISFEPGSEYQYSGEGFQYLAKVLAHLLETDDKGLEQAYQKEIARSLGLNTTRFIQDRNNLSNKALPYKAGIKVEQRYSNDIFGAAFSVHSEAKDFTVWLQALLNEEGLTAESFEALFNDQIIIDMDEDNPNEASAWTLGFGKYEVGEDVYYGHGGNNYGYTSGFFIDREAQLGAVIFTNADQVSDFVIEMFRFLIEY